MEEVCVKVYFFFFFENISEIDASKQKKNKTVA